MSIVSDLSRIKTAKSDIANAIAGKGVEVPEGTKIDGYASLIEGISTKAEVGYLQMDKRMEFFDVKQREYPFESNETIIGIEQYIKIDSLGKKTEIGVAVTIDTDYVLKVYELKVDSSNTTLTLLNQVVADSNFTISDTDNRIGVFIYNSELYILGANSMMCSYNLDSDTWTEPCNSGVDFIGCNTKIFGSIYAINNVYSSYVKKIFNGGSLVSENFAYLEDNKLRSIRPDCVFSINNQMYVLGHYASSGNIYYAMFKYDPEASKWTKQYDTPSMASFYRNTHIVTSENAYYFACNGRSLKIYKFGDASYEVYNHPASMSDFYYQPFSCKIGNAIVLFEPVKKGYAYMIERETYHIKLSSGMKIYTNHEIYQGEYDKWSSPITVTEDGEFIFLKSSIYYNTYLTIIKDNTICYMQLTENSSGIYGYFLTGMVVNGIEVTTSGAQTIATTLPVTVTYETA